MTSWKTIAVAALTLGMTAGGARAESGVSAATRAMQSCLAIMSDGGFSDPLRPEEVAPPTPEDRIGQELLKSGDPTVRLPSDFGQVYVVRPKDQCVVDTFNLDADALANAVGELLAEAPYNAYEDIEAIAIPPAAGVHIWVVHKDALALSVAVATIDPDSNRTILMVGPEHGSE